MTLLDNSAKWVLKDGEKLTASAATYNGITKTLTYRATDGESGNKDHCILKFEFEGMCMWFQAHRHKTGKKDCTPRQ